MNKYRNRNSKNEILTDIELADFSESCILISMGYAKPIFSRGNNSHPSNVVVLEPVAPNYRIVFRREINSTQWDKVLKPVVERIAPLIGKLPITENIEYKNKIIGRETYVRLGLGSLFDPRESMFIDLVRKMIIKQAKDQGYGT